MTTNNMANRPSQSDQEFVKNAKGQRVRNSAWTGPKGKKSGTATRAAAMASRGAVLAQAARQQDRDEGFDQDGYMNRASRSAFVKSEMIDALKEDLRKDPRLAGWDIVGQAEFGSDPAGTQIYDRVELHATSPEGYTMTLKDSRTVEDNRRAPHPTAGVTVNRTTITSVNHTERGEGSSEGRKVDEDNAVQSPRRRTQSSDDGFDLIIEKYNAEVALTRKANPEAFSLN